MVTIEERKRQYMTQIQQINNPTARRVAMLKGMAKLVEEFGNESERFGIKFGLYPLWVAFDTPWPS